MVAELTRISTAILDVEHVMIESIEFTNFKALRDTLLPLSPFTLLLGPNGSGKSTVLKALASAAGTAALGWDQVRSVTAEDRGATVEVIIGLRLGKTSYGVQ